MVGVINKLRAFFHNILYKPPKGNIQWFKCHKCGFAIAWTFKDWEFIEQMYPNETLPVCPYCNIWMCPCKEYEV